MSGPSGIGHGKLSIPAIAAVIDSYIKGKLTADDAKARIGGSSQMGFIRLVNARRRDLGLPPTVAIGTNRKELLRRLEVVEAWIARHDSPGNV